ncbi:helix-turn-helix transcriptional regulator [Rhodococcus electrodiphilus]|uniref:helix-turn-helix domain-containing protein n=1 Tax=Rhodococcus ruber TaxID=1830 RepID=UPI0026F44FA6|nr:helix-turn-helix transcriptional regulator [Rhodococcus ruber]MDO2377450.1 helix-turn-helix transcriptional regulator [Rhodococcus ruber]
MTQPDWHVETTRRIATEIRRLRGDRSAQWLSDRTAELGFRVSRSTISDMEVGRRSRLELVEFIALARALGVPPVTLLYPGIPDEPVEYVPGITVDSWTAIKWFAGQEADPDVDNSAVDLMRRHDTTLRRLLRAYDEQRATIERRPDAYTQGEQTREKIGQQHMETMAELQVRSAIDRLKIIRDEMRKIGLTPPSASNFVDEDIQLDMFDEFEEDQ